MNEINPSASMRENIISSLTPEKDEELQDALQELSGKDSKVMNADLRKQMAALAGQETIDPAAARELIMRARQDLIVQGEAEAGDFTKREQEVTAEPAEAAPERRGFRAWAREKCDAIKEKVRAFFYKEVPEEAEDTADGEKGQESKDEESTEKSTAEKMVEGMYEIAADSGPSVRDSIINAEKARGAFFDANRLHKENERRLSEVEAKRELLLKNQRELWQANEDSPDISAKTKAEAEAEIQRLSQEINAHQGEKKAIEEACRQSEQARKEAYEQLKKQEEDQVQEVILLKQKKEQTADNMNKIDGEIRNIQEKINALQSKVSEISNKQAQKIYIEQMRVFEEQIGDWEKAKAGYEKMIQRLEKTLEKHGGHFQLQDENGKRKDMLEKDEQSGEALLSKDAVLEHFAVVLKAVSDMILQKQGLNNVSYEDLQRSEEAVRNKDEDDEYQKWDQTPEGKAWRGILNGVEDVSAGDNSDEIIDLMRKHGENEGAEEEEDVSGNQKETEKKEPFIRAVPTAKEKTPDVSEEMEQKEATEQQKADALKRAISAVAEEKNEEISFSTLQTLSLTNKSIGHEEWQNSREGMLWNEIKGKFAKKLNLSETEAEHFMESVTLYEDAKQPESGEQDDQKRKQKKEQFEYYRQHEESAKRVARIAQEMHEFIKEGTFEKNPQVLLQAIEVALYNIVHKQDDKKIESLRGKEIDVENEAELLDVRKEDIPNYVMLRDAQNYAEQSKSPEDTLEEIEKHLDETYGIQRIDLSSVHTEQELKESIRSGLPIEIKVTQTDDPEKAGMVEVVKEGYSISDNPAYNAKGDFTHTYNHNIDAKPVVVLYQLKNTGGAGSNSG